MYPFCKARKSYIQGVQQLCAVHFLRPPAGAQMLGGGYCCFQRMWGNMLVQTICKKSSAKAGMAIALAKRQEVAAHRYAVLAVAIFAMLSGGRVLFFK